MVPIERGLSFRGRSRSHLWYQNPTLHQMVVDLNDSRRLTHHVRPVVKCRGLGVP